MVALRDCALVAPQPRGGRMAPLGAPCGRHVARSPLPVPRELGADDHLTDRVILTGRQTAACLFVSFGSL
jgi:hypothetical protein